MPSNPTIILVHGAWHGSWCWWALEPALRERGIAVQAVDLTSHGTDPGSVGDLRTDTGLVRRTAQSVSGPVVLLGHSYGGVVITEAADGLDNVSHLIYLAAFLPDVGDSMIKLTGGGQAPWITFADGLLTVGDGWGRKLFYSDCDPDAAAAAESRLQPQSAASFQQDVRVTAWRSIPSSYIVCAGDKAVPPAGQRHMASRTGAVVELPGGHSPFISQPQRLADLLQERL